MVFGLIYKQTVQVEDGDLESAIQITELVRSCLLYNSSTIHLLYNYSTIHLMYNYRTIHLLYNSSTMHVLYFLNF
jgi:hypothetical protein